MIINIKDQYLKKYVSVHIIKTITYRHNHHYYYRHIYAPMHVLHVEKIVGRRGVAVILILSNLNNIQIIFYFHYIIIVAFIYSFTLYRKFILCFVSRSLFM